MSNTITEGEERALPPDADGVVHKVPTPALVELKSEVLQASAHKDAGQNDAMRERSSIESRTDLRLAATNEAMRADPVRPLATLVIEQDVARRWADLDAGDFGRIRSDGRREAALDAIAGHVRASPAYSDELAKRSPKLASAARTLNEAREKIEGQDFTPVIEKNAATLAFQSVPEAEQRKIAAQDAQTLAAMPDGARRQLAAATMGENARKHEPYREALATTAPLVMREVEAAVGERDAVRAIERRNAEVMPIARDGMTLPQARSAVREDLDAFSTIRDPAARHMAAVAISDNAKTQAAYRSELQSQAPEVAKEIAAAAAENERRASEKERRKGIDFDSIQADKVERAAKWTPTQAEQQVQKDLVSLGLADKTERYYLMGDMATSMQSSKAYSASLQEKAPDVAAEVEAQRTKDSAERAATEQRKDNIAAAAQSRSALIDAAALAAVASVRERETARVVEQLAGAPDTSTQQLRDAQFLRDTRQEPDVTGSPERRAPAPTDIEAAEQRGRAIKRPVDEDELSQALRTRYIVSHEKRGLLDRGSTDFVFRNGEEQGRVAFSDAGKALSTEREDKATIRAMIEVATTKNWKEITVSGTDDFRRQAWIEASLSGMKVRGYEPREADKEILADLQLRNKPTNVITVADKELNRDQGQDHTKISEPRTRERKHIDGDALTTAERTVLDAAVSKAMGSKEFQDQVTDPATREKWAEATFRELEARLRGERVYVGEIVDHGKAPYKFDKDKDESYYVTLRTNAGEQVIWGKGLAEAMQERKTGEQIVLQNIGKRDVTVHEKVRDAQGQLVVRPKESHLNTWKSELLSRFSEKARADLATRSASRKPTLLVYDAKAPRAPAQVAVQARPQDLARNAEQQRNSRER